MVGITGALNNAVTGLTAASRAAEVVSSNVANAMTEGYARREISLSSDTLGGDGGGVRINGINRMVNETLLQDKRLADAAAADATARTTFYADLENQIGDPTTEGSLSWTISKFEDSLLTAASMPDSSARLSSAVDAARLVTDKLNSVSADLQQTRLEADQSIAKQVNTLNETLGEIELLNRTITTQIAVGRDANGLMDQRQMLVDSISEIVPIKVVQRDNNQIALFTKGGGILLDGHAYEIGFTGAGVMAADMTLAGGQLSGITVNGQAMTVGEGSQFGGGTLGAAFAVRDTLGTEAQAKLDAVARDLISRFESTSVDPTLNPGDAGLFTDGGGPLVVANEAGLAGRISINAIVDPLQGGAAWHMRDGLNAATPGVVSDATLLNAMSSAMTTQSVPASGNFGALQRSMAGLSADLLSFASSSRQSSELTQGYTNARQEALHEMALADGVDTDYEMQNLLVVEKAYAANARVIQTIDALIQQLLEL
ncbi:flagellar hook-associated protein 1 FlgK [Rhodobacter aestuarii]|uniref:Flagellar hook-associated protein 1 n=1 Tax=Rhodobacter aestuarii TaxID=453582 RepID=A0A1N7LJ30_9RHOB|nr:MULTISPECIES: flagellar hook-associated protein FlgK [Rhodobacter]PTV95221.1 flagellar hook-associated protein 1 FlgK [Rhodobacter aestuarii]SIS73858.1 flagellar hook-associated protein 1 FlgK [Rhodobacter aestuarii]SOC07915.1 flagellar hook-associated protein 1 FlgK [Rhodobacter sp. JA431]